MAASQVERIVELERQVAELTAALEQFPAALATSLKAMLEAQLAPLAERVVEAHSRIDHAGRVFKDMRRAMTPRAEPVRKLPQYISVAAIDEGVRLPYAQFCAAVDELRARDGADASKRYADDAVRAQARTDQVMRENREEAAL